MNMEDRIPPHNKEAEESVLGAMMMTEEAAATVFGRATKSEIFYHDIHRMIFDTMLQLFILGKPIDQITVSDMLKRKDQLERVGGSYYITGLLETTPTASRVDYYLDIVIAKWGLRRLISDGVANAAEAYADNMTPEEILEGSEKRLLDLYDELKGDAQIVKIGDVIDDIEKEAFEEIERARDSGVFGLSSGFTTLDSYTYGLEAEYTIIAARPSVGKTALAFGIGYNVSKQGVPVYIISLEMTLESAAKRMAYALGSTSKNLVKLDTTGEEEKKLRKGFKKLAAVPLHIDQIAVMNNIELRSRVRQQILKNGIKLVIIDYLQLMEAMSPKERKYDANRQEEMRIISKSIANLKKETGLPFIVLSQLSRKSQERKDKRPMLSDIRESGAIEQDADKVILLHREDYYRSEKQRQTLITEGRRVIVQECDAMIAKNRSGPTGTVKLKFIEEFAKFENWEYEELVKLYEFNGEEMPKDIPPF